MKPEDKIQPNSKMIELLREAHSEEVVEEWHRSVLRNPAQAQEEFLRGYADTLAQVPTQHPEALQKLDAAVPKFKEMLKMTPTEFAREVLGVFVEAPKDTRMERADDESNVVQCEECPYSLVCLAGRLFGKHAPSNIMCVKCGQICVVLGKKEEPVRTKEGHRVTTFKAQSFYCCERKLTNAMEWKYRRQERLMKAGTITSSVPTYIDPAPQGKEVPLSICGACAEHDVIVQRYRRQQKERHNWTWVDEHHDEV